MFNVWSWLDRAFGNRWALPRVSKRPRRKLGPFSFGHPEGL